MKSEHNSTDESGELSPERAEGITYLMIHKYTRTHAQAVPHNESVIPLGVGPPPLRQRVSVAGRRAHQVRGRVHPAHVLLQLLVPRV